MNKAQKKRLLANIKAIQEMEPQPPPMLVFHPRDPRLAHLKQLFIKEYDERQDAKETQEVKQT